MSIVAWIVLGLLAGFLASKVLNASGAGLPLDILLGMVGAVVGGWIFTVAEGVGVTGFNARSLMVAVIGAVVFLVAWHAIRRSSSRA